MLRRRADVTKSLTALPGVAFVVGNRRGGAEPGGEVNAGRTARTRYFTPPNLRACGRGGSRPASDKKEEATVPTGGGGNIRSRSAEPPPPPTARSCRDVVARPWRAE